jgi:hypothetical protein
LIGAATTVGNENYPAKLADWLRDHHGAFLSNAAERWAYDFDAPSKGGTPHHLNALPPAPPPTPQPAHPAVSAEPAPSMTPPPIPLVARPALAGEGRWQPVGPAVDGVPAMYEVQFRADDVYTSQITTAVEIDPHFLRLTLVPGLTQPGGTWPHPPMITHAELPDIVAAFNGGFRFADAQGGMYLDHRVAAPLRDGAASFVTYADGHVDIGSWGSEVRMTPDVVSVLQNLVPMVDDGRITPSATSSDHRIWGDTLGADTIVARSGLGVTAGGALVYVAGPALSGRTCGP